MKQNKKLLSTTIVSLATSIILFSTPLHAAEYKIDPTHSFVEFKIKHLGYSWLSGRFNKVSGNFNFDSSKGEDYQKIKIDIPTKSIDSNHAERDKHIREIINVGSHGGTSFSSTKYTGDKNGGVLKGKLTFHGVTKDIEVKVKKIGEGKDPWGGYRSGFEGQFSINRKDFGVEYDLGPEGWSVDIDVYIEGIKS